MNAYVIVTGTRYVAEEITRHHIEADLDRIEADQIHLFVGDANGVDRIAREWGARNERATVHIFEADWLGNGPTAGPIRNERLVRSATQSAMGPRIALAYPGPDSRGTWDCIKRAVLAGWTVTVKGVE